MLTSDFTRVSEDAITGDSAHMQEDRPNLQEDEPSTSEDRPSMQVSPEGKEPSPSDVPVEEGKSSEDTQDGTPLNDIESQLVTCDVEEAKDEMMAQPSLSQNSEPISMLQPPGTGPDKTVDVGHVTPLVLDTQQETTAEQSVAITKLLSPPESSPSVTDCPPQDICDGLEAVSSEEEPVESRVSRIAEGNQQGDVEVVDIEEKNLVADADSKAEPCQHEPCHEKVLAVDEDGSLPGDPAASAPEVTCNGQVHRAITPTHHNPVMGEADVYCGADNLQVSESEVSCLQHSAPATEGPMAAPVQLLTPPLDRDQVFTCALPDETDAAHSHFKHHDITRKHRNYRHSSHKEHPASKSYHRRSLSPAGQRRERDRGSTEKGAFHHTGSERGSSQHQAHAKMSRDRSSSRDRVQDRLVGAHEGQQYHQTYHSHRDGSRSTKHRHHDGQWGSRHHEKYSQRNGHHQSQPRSSQWADRWRHPSTHPSSARESSHGDATGNSGYGNKRRHSSYSEHASCDSVPKPKRTVS